MSPLGRGFLFLLNQLHERKPTVQLLASFPFAHYPRFAGKVVFVTRRQQVDMPNHCISSNKIVYYTFMVLLHMQCPSGCYAGLSYYLQFLLIPHGSYCVLHATLFITSFVPLHYTSFAAKPFASRPGIPCQSQKPCTEGMHQPFRKPALQCSPGSISLHYVIHSLQ